MYDDDWPILCDYWGSPDQGHRAGGRTQGGHPRGQAHFLFVYSKFSLIRLNICILVNGIFFFSFFSILEN